MHVAFILDGNRRWARQRGKAASVGHRAGIENFRNLLAYMSKKNITVVTAYALSTENIQKRSSVELKGLFFEIERLAKKVDEFVKEDMCVRLIGCQSSFPTSCQSALRTLVKKTATGKRLTVVLALGYGSRDEIARAVRSREKDKKKKPIQEYLDTAGLPDPHLLIRTGGAKRLSNFLLWQLSYTELYFTNTFWPDFGPKSLSAALGWYKKRTQNFGA